MTRRVLLTLGRLPKGLELARCLHKAGCAVYVADPFGTHLSKLSNAVQKSYRVTAPNKDEAAYRTELLDIIHREDICLLVPVSEEVPFIAQLADQLPTGVELMAPDMERLLSVHDKLKFIERVTAAGLTAPPSARADKDEALALIAEGETVFKPMLGCSGNGLAFLPKDGQRPIDFPASEAVVQKRIRGREISSLTFAHEGEILLSALYHGLVYAGTVSTCFERLDDETDAENWIREFVRAENWSGFIAFDFIIDETGKAWPIECNPRLTSGIHFMDHDALARAVLAQAPAGANPYKPQQRFQEGHTCLTKAYGKFFNPPAFFKRLGLLFSTRDVLWSSKDPLPFLTMTPMSWPILSQVIFKGASFGAAATRDIEWVPEGTD